MFNGTVPAGVIEAISVATHGEFPQARELPVSSEFVLPFSSCVTKLSELSLSLSVSLSVFVLFQGSENLPANLPLIYVSSWCCA